MDDGISLGLFVDELTKGLGVMELLFIIVVSSVLIDCVGTVMFKVVPIRTVVLKV